ncbi:hypothetical protein NLG97_g5828 [Lecanicillium saksenae]|uniref:Uncharacterized protein n=1 Tax=Lecanicillium saksenae TaxID=468837 RepID=A0ACC1QT16_9HYPO|nr:hypothetical protein NLG97_g5828 [Lecanicillium saksenae]
MHFSSILAALSAFAGLSSAGMLPIYMANETDVSVGALANVDAAAAAAAFGCGKLQPHLNKADCEHMAKIGMAGQGINSLKPNGKAWIGGGGPNTFKFTNRATHPSAVPVTVVLWAWNGDRDYQAMCVNVRRPYITVSLPKPGDSIVISVANNVVGGFAALNNHATILSNAGLVYNTWGEFNTKGDSTVDVSREVNTRGNVMSIRASNGCVSNMSKCVFLCKNGGVDHCGDAGSYHLTNCGPPNPGAHTDNGGADGGCSGWGNHGKHLDVDLGRS